MKNDIVVEMNAEKASEGDGLLKNKPSAEQVRPVDVWG